MCFQHVLKDVAHHGNLLRLKHSLRVEESVEYHWRSSKLPARRCYAIAKGGMQKLRSLVFALPSSGILALGMGGDRSKSKASAAGHGGAWAEAIGNIKPG